MNKQELIGAVAENTGLPRNEAARAVEALLDTIGQELSEGREVRIVNFGTFAVGVRKASPGRNPRTGEPISIDATRQPKFRAGKQLKDLVSA